MEIDAIQATVSGKVQGVNFRNFVQQKASGLKLSGYAENGPNGVVRVFAQGLTEDLERLIEHLHKGPFLARVMRVDVEWVEPEENLRGFKIVY